MIIQSRQREDLRQVIARGFAVVQTKEMDSFPWCIHSARFSTEKPWKPVGLLRNYVAAASHAPMITVGLPFSPTLGFRLRWRHWSCASVAGSRRIAIQANSNRRTRVIFRGLRLGMSEHEGPLAEVIQHQSWRY
jgi:hypothetical protein